MLLSLLYIVVALVIAGVILYFVNSAPPGLDPTIRWLIRAVVIVVCLVLVLYFLVGLVSGLPGITGHRPF